MCSINPKYQHKFEFNIYTAHGSPREWEQLLNHVRSELLKIEIKFNSELKLRAHLTEPKQ